MYHYKFSLTELDNMLPFEREIYLTLLSEQIKKENEIRKQQQQQAGQGIPSSVRTYG